ncbi:MAG: SDR family NAD(P)-dependent oxidoreductase [Nocardiopsaceae bacterium]|jgi:short-subunit dehydrogenase|nr:SDR family NAD(P)-dependent oxidoreductase [Nocardiopsaceae bacterium]
MAIPAGRPLAVVTSASSGVGFELAGQFAKEGFDLIVAAEDDDIATAARALEGFGGQASPAQVDLSSYDGVENLYLTIQSAACPVAALAINAQAGFGGDFVRDSQMADELRLVNHNATGAVHLTKRVLADMLAHDHGTVLFTLPITAPGPYNATYRASTAFLRAFAAELERELEDSLVTVAAITPVAGDLDALGDAVASYVPLAGSPGRTMPVS